MTPKMDANEREALRALLKAIAPGLPALLDAEVANERAAGAAAERAAIVAYLKDAEAVQRRHSAKSGDPDHDRNAQVYREAWLVLENEATEAAEVSIDAARIGASAAQDALAALQDALAERDELAARLEQARQSHLDNEAAAAEIRRECAKRLGIGEREDNAAGMVGRVLAERDELRAEICAYQGRPEGALPGWEYDRGAYVRLLDTAVLMTDSRGWRLVLRGGPVVVGDAPTPRAAMRAAEAAARARGLLTEGS